MDWYRDFGHPCPAGGLVGKALDDVGLHGAKHCDNDRTCAWGQSTTHDGGACKDDLARWLAESRFPFVLKSVESFGGRGVRIVNSAGEADRAWEALTSPPSLARAVKRAIVDRDVNYIVPRLRRILPAVNAQSLVRGQDANCTIAFWQGAVLASMTVPISPRNGQFAGTGVGRTSHRAARNRGSERSDRSSTQAVGTGRIRFHSRGTHWPRTPYRDERTRDPDLPPAAGE